jgi:serine/threonine protein kinase
MLTGGLFIEETKGLAICPACQREFANRGDFCEKDGLYAIDKEDFKTTDSLLGRKIDGKYIALRRVGRGGMGSVYEAKQLGLDRTVALKVLSQSLKNRSQAFERFLREAESIGRISHHNIVKLYDFGVDPNGLAYLAMEFVDGRVLSSLAPSELSAQLVAHICMQILSALKVAHNNNIIHRDLKPENIMLSATSSDEYCVKVLDFGLASLINSSRISVVGEALGTPWYMSPEQATASQVTFASDIYSLGCILYELISSKPPFPGNRPYNVMMQHVNADPPELVSRPELEISNEFKAFVMRCLQKKLSRRYKSAKSAIRALQTLPEWLAASLSQPRQSIRIGMKQLVIAAETKEELSSDLLPAVDPAQQISAEHQKAVPHPLKPLPLYMRVIQTLWQHRLWLLLSLFIIVIVVFIYWGLQ